MTGRCFAANWAASLISILIFDSLHEPVRRPLARFGCYRTHGRRPFLIGDDAILESIDYQEMLKEEASLVKMAFAINALDIQRRTGKGAESNPCNETGSTFDQARQREIGPTYDMVPDFEELET